MARKNTHNTKGKIIEAAWDLFYRQGYDDTTVEEIIAASGTSRGSFYHYFEGKDALLSSLSYLFDRKYEELSSTLDPNMDRFDQLMYLNRELFTMIENSISLDLLARLYSSQLVTRGTSTCWTTTASTTSCCGRLCWRASSGGNCGRICRSARWSGCTLCASGP